MSLFADPYLYYCGNDAGQRALMRELQSAARYAQQHGVLLVATTGNQQIDLRHPIDDVISPDGPDDVADRARGRQQLPRAPGRAARRASRSARPGPVGYPGYTMNIADYSSVGGDIAAPGGDYFSASNSVQDAILAAMPADSAIYGASTRSTPQFPGITTAAAHGDVRVDQRHVDGGAARDRCRRVWSRSSTRSWGAAAVAAALQAHRDARVLPGRLEPLGPGDERLRCYGGSDGHTSFFGAGLVNAARATQL